MDKPIIAIDIDEVLSPLHRPFLIHHNQVYGTDFVYPDLEGRYYLEQFTSDAPEVTESKIREFVDHPSFETVIVPLPGAIEAIKHLKKSFDLVIVTSRQPFYRKVTERFLKRYFPRQFNDVHFIPHFAGAALNPAAAKLTICEKVGASYLIDDNASTAMHAAEKGIGALLFGDYHWNQTDGLPEGVTRCKDWPAVLEYFDGRDG